MKSSKLKKLKQRTKIKLIAAEAGTSHVYLSGILGGRERCSYELACRLAAATNKLTFSYDYTPEDFRPNG